MAELTKITADLNGMPGSPSKDPHKLDKAAELPGNLDALIDEKYELMAEVLSAIKKLPNPKHRTVLIGRYINMKTLELLSVEMGYSYQGLCELRNRAEMELFRIVFTPVDRS